MAQGGFMDFSLAKPFQELYNNKFIEMMMN